MRVYLIDCARKPGRVVVDIDDRDLDLGLIGQRRNSSVFGDHRQAERWHRFPIQCSRDNERARFAFHRELVVGWQHAVTDLGVFAVVKVGGEEHEHGGADRGVLKHIHNVGSVLKSEVGT